MKDIKVVSHLSKTVSVPTLRYLDSRSIRAYVFLGDTRDPAFCVCLVSLMRRLRPYSRQTDLLKSARVVFETWLHVSV